MTSLPTLVFDETVFTVVDRDGQPWLRGPEIATALGYADADAVSRIYRRNADEFPEAMSQTVNLTVSQNSGQLQREVRIFSLRGAYLVGMFASTHPAKRFRRWVLDVLEGKAQAQPVRAAQQPQPAAPSLQAKVASLEAQLANALEKQALLMRLADSQAMVVALSTKPTKRAKRQPRGPITETDITLMSKLHAEGLSLSAIAKATGRSIATASWAVRMTGAAT